MPKSPHKERDLRAYARSTQFKIVLGALLITFVVGNGLIWLLYGSDAASLGLLCMGIGLVPVLLIIISMWMMNWIVQKTKGD